MHASICMSVVYIHIYIHILPYISVCGIYKYIYIYIHVYVCVPACDIYACLTFAYTHTQCTRMYLGLCI